MTDNERKLAELLEKAAAGYGKLNAKQQKFAVGEIDRTRLELIELLNEYAGKDGTIPRGRVNTLLRDLAGIEDNIRKYGTSALDSVIKETAAYGTAAAEAAVVKTLGDSAGLGISFNRMNADVFSYVVNRFDTDGLVLSDRIWRMAGETRDELNKVIRSAIIRGQDLKTTVAQVRGVYANDTWKIKRLVVTEGNTAYRAADAIYAQKSDVVSGLQIHRGKADRPDHKCTVLSLADSYGMGTGVYPATATEIYNPHPNCTSFLTYVLT
ncbi:hypothetical protein PghCCS26_47800 [Paenibacillus glycanilyticus]|uniref:Phage head morphogenesis domain-containing protein n=1 Tax=Paenibacillus glycanilyticus TaxID=126569 RepID=A0ABQ6NSW2_9BACL|nr:hypothetical protein [Paenibacillus glycanilyticus]GMK47650.1 hypothetical protein PghCCS26_47800 [Paenibacillus glycanilyticus]